MFQVDRLVLREKLECTVISLWQTSTAFLDAAKLQLRFPMVKDWNRAAALRAKEQELIDAMKLPDRSNRAATVAINKWLLRNLGIIAHDQVIAPLQPLSDAEKLLLQERALPLLKRHSASLLRVSRGASQNLLPFSSLS